MTGIRRFIKRNHCRSQLWVTLVFSVSKNSFSNTNKSFFLSLTLLAGLPTYMPQAVVLLLTKVIAPIEHPSAIFTPGQIILPAPTTTCRFKTTLFFDSFLYSDGTKGLTIVAPL